MTRHLLRLMWNRKRQNMLLGVEIFVAFLVVVVVSVLAMYLGYNALRPLGFTTDRVWQLQIVRAGSRSSDPSARDAERQRLKQVMATLAGFPEVERAALGFTGPYRTHTWGLNLNVEGQPQRQVTMNRVDDAFREVLGLELISGRWFSREDDGVAWEPVILNRRLATAIFGEANPVGQTIRETERETPFPRSENERRPKRVVGVVEDFRQFGEVSPPAHVLLHRMTLDASVERIEMPEIALLTLAPGTTAAFEEQLVKQLRGVAPEWSFKLESVEALRESMIGEYTVLLSVASVVAGAMLLMVALGLTGVVWQSVTQRTREFGLRRAQGATARRIGRQVVAELVVMTSFAVVAGCVLLLQIPLLPLPPEIAVVPRAVFVSGVLAAVATVYVVTVLCAWYPSRLATRVLPTEALHYE